MCIILIRELLQGATAFAASVKLKLIISGSDDGLLRVWNNVVNAKPIATLNVHKCRIVDVKIFEKQELFISLSADGVRVLCKTFNFRWFIKCDFLGAEIVGPK